MALGRRGVVILCENMERRDFSLSGRDDSTISQEFVNNLKRKPYFGLLCMDEKVL